MAVGAGVLLLLYSFSILGSAVGELLAYGFEYSLVFIAGFAFVLLWLGLKCLAKSQIRVHLVPEGIALSLLGKTFRTYPVKDMKLACFVDKGTYQESNVFLCVCPHDQEALALLWQQSCRKNPITRHDIPFLQRKNDWQRSFARSFLRKKTSILPWVIPEKGIFYMVSTQERRELVEQMYPQLPWSDLTQLPEQYYQKPQEPNGMKPRPPETPERLLQGHRYVADFPIAAMILVFGPCCLLLISGIFFLEDTAGAVLSGLSILWLFSSLFSVIPLSNRWVSVREDGLHLYLGKREIRFLPETEIRTIYCFDYKVKGGVCRYMAVTKLAPEKITAQQEAYMTYSRRKRECLSAYSLSRSWPYVTQCRYLARRILMFGLWDREFLILAHEPEREEWLKDRYPQADWIDIGEVINLNQFYPHLS